MKFSGRTPSPVRFMLGPRARGSQRAQPARAIAMRVALAALALCALSTLGRSFIGDVPALDARLQLFSSSDFAPAARLETLPAGGLASFGAVGVFWEHLTQQLGRGGAPWLLLPVSGLMGLVLLWWLLALLGEWRRPPIVLIALIITQLWAAGYLLLPYMPPPQKLNTEAAAFEFRLGWGDTAGTPQQAVNECRARGGSGLIFAGLHRVLSETELRDLQQANSDLTLLNGSEYRHDDAMLIFVGVRQAITPQSHDITSAIKAAKSQGALVFAFGRESVEYSSARLLQLGVDGLIVTPDQSNVTEEITLAKANGRVVVAAPADGAAAWTLLPRGTASMAELTRAVRSRRVAIALSSFDLAHPVDNPTQAVRVSWQKLSRAQRVNVIFGAAAIIALLVFWGAGVPSAAAVSGPQRVVGFLRRRRMAGRVLGLFLMLLAWVASLLIIAWAIFGLRDALAVPVSPLYALPAFAALALLYIYGRFLWRQVQ